MFNLLNNKKGITLIALVITIIILLILAGVTINFTIGKNGILDKASQATEETAKQTATEIMNLKITNIQISSYTETQKLPTLQYVSDRLCEDNDMEYVVLKDKEQASLTKITVGLKDSILTKLKEYPYVFEINNRLQLASIDGIKISTNNNETISSITMEELQNIIDAAINKKLENYSTSTEISEEYATKEDVSIPTLDWNNKVNITNNLKTIGGSYTANSNGIIRVFLDQNNTSNCCLNLSTNATAGNYKKYYANNTTSWATFADEFEINKSDSVTVASDSILNGFRSFYIEFVPYK